jgi:hypothetical protein
MNFSIKQQKILCKKCGAEVVMPKKDGLIICQNGHPPIIARFSKGKIKEEIDIIGANKLL